LSDSAVKDGQIDYSAYTYAEVIEGLENILPEEDPINAANLRKRLAQVAPVSPPPEAESPTTPVDAPTVLGRRSFLERLHPA
jgi:hypothetical protein